MVEMKSLVLSLPPSAAAITNRLLTRQVNNVLQHTVLGLHKELPAAVPVEPQLTTPHSYHQLVRSLDPGDGQTRWQLNENCWTPISDAFV